MAKGNQYPPLETLARFWETVHAQHGICHIDFGGGEPTVYPRFPELVETLIKHHTVHLTTNLWWELPRWESFADRVDMSKIRMSASFHPTETDFDPFLEKARFLVHEKNFAMSVVIVAYPPMLGKLQRYLELVHAAGIDTNLQPFCGTWEGKTYPAAYTHQERELIYGVSEKTESMFEAKLPYAMDDSSPYGKLCTAGQLYLHINQVGDIYRCTNVPQISSDRLGSITDGFTPFAAPQPCPQQHCQCETNWLVTEMQNAKLLRLKTA